LGDRGVRLLLSDSTNASAPGRNIDEAEVAENLEPAIAEWPGRVIVTLFSSNLYRISSLHKIAKKQGRALCLVGRSLHRYIQIGRFNTDLDLPEPHEVFELSELKAFDPSKVMVLCTGSQAEPMSALFRASRKKHSGFVLGEGDRIIFSSREIPGNEFRIGKMINDLCRLGASVIKGSRCKMHASGHARADELTEMIELLRPELFVPVHGEYAFLQDHISLAEAAGITNTMLIENGSILQISGKEERVIAEIDAEPYVHDSGVCNTATKMMLSERKRVAWNGVVDAHVTRRGEFAKKSFDVDLSSTALFVDEGKLLEQCKKQVMNALRKLDDDVSAEKIEEKVKQEVRRFFRSQTTKRPYVFTHLVDER
jgi:ribonuclease J